MGLLTRPAATRNERRGGYRWAVLVEVCASALIVNVDNTILNVALPTLVRKLAATSSDFPAGRYPGRDTPAGRCQV